MSVLRLPPRHECSPPDPALATQCGGSRGHGIQPVINPLSDPDWDAKLAASFPEASPFFQAAWAHVLSSTYGYDPVYLGAEASGKLQWVLPLMEVCSRLTGTRGVSLPFTDTCIAEGLSNASPAAIHEALFAVARARRWQYVELRGTPPLNPATAPSVTFRGHQLSLQPDPATLFSGFDSSVRRAVRKAENEGVTVGFETSLDAVRSFYRLLCKTRTRHGLPPQPWRFFANVHRHIVAPGAGFVTVARLREVPVAAAVFFRRGTQLLYKFAASDDAFQHVRGNNLVIWRTIEHFSRQGCTTLDFGRTSLANEGLRRFKLSWNTVERAIDYYRYDVKTGTVIPTPDRATEGLHTRLFRSLPPALTRLIGAAAYKHLG